MALGSPLAGGAGDSLAAAVRPGDSRFETQLPGAFSFPRGESVTAGVFCILTVDSGCVPCADFLPCIWSCGSLFFIIYLFFLGGARREDSPPVSGGLCRPPRRHTFSLCKQLICMAMTFVAPVISSDNGRACKADLKTYSLIMCC